MKANYQDWAKSSTEPSAWRLCEISVAQNEDCLGGVDIYLVRPNSSRNTFTLQLDTAEAQKLRDALNGLLD